MPDLHLERYRLAMERVRLRAMRAVEQRVTSRPTDRLAELDGAIATIERGLAETRSGGRDTALAHQLGLHDDVIDLMWTAVAITADPRLIPHLQALAGADAARGVSLAVHTWLAQLDGDRSLRLGLAFDADHPLMRYRLLLAIDDLQTAARAFRAAPRLAAYLAGRDDVDSDLAGVGGAPAPPEQPCLDEGTSRVVHQLASLLIADRGVVAIIDGPRGIGRRSAIAIAAAQKARRAVAVDVARLASGEHAFDRALAALLREQVLTGAILAVAGVDELITPDGDSSRLRALARMLEVAPGTVAVTTTLPGQDLGTTRSQVRISMPVPDTRARRALWDHVLHGVDGISAADRDVLAMRYRLGAGGIDGAVDAALLIAEDPLTLSTPELIAGIRSNIAEQMGGLAARVQVTQRWDELVLGRDTLDQIKALISRVRYGHTVLEKWGLGAKLARGTGVAALFSGPPGTGKTMVAGLIARELELELYQVDLSKVVSKWVGETERQLSRIFDAADAGHALLLFDEADALFARRTEVKAAIDRYANLEVNYLLQRIESFGGITILTTNLDQSIDPALMRRLAAHVKFWPPEEAERASLWRSMLGGPVPLGKDVDVAELARTFADMTGANIRNAAIAGAFLAASEGAMVTMRHLQRAARGEYASMGRTLSGASR